MKLYDGPIWRYNLLMKLLLVDGNAVLHRAYYALPDWRNRSGEATAGVYGFLSMVLKAVDDLDVSHLVVVFDTPHPTFRHQMYVGYQTNREKDRQVSEDIWGQVEKLTEVFKKMGVPVFTVVGFEADDVIGTVSKQAEESAMDVLVITGDKDLMQLVSDKVKLYMPQKGLSDNVVIDADKVMEKLGVHPAQIVDYKALVGDSSDNYPGVTGIGPKTAVHLLAEYGSFDGVYKHLSDVGEKVREKLIQGHEGGQLSKELAMIRRDVPVTFHAEKAVMPERGKAAEVLKELGYRSLVKRMTGEEIKPDDNQRGLFD